MSKPAIINFIADAVQWAISIVAIGAIHGAGIIENQGVALAGVALWLAIRARRKADVNTAHKSETEA